MALRGDPGELIRALRGKNYQKAGEIIVADPSVLLEVKDHEAVIDKIIYIDSLRVPLVYLVVCHCNAAALEAFLKVRPSLAKELISDMEFGQQNPPLYWIERKMVNLRPETVDRGDVKAKIRVLLKAGADLGDELQVSSDPKSAPILLEAIQYGNHVFVDCALQVRNELKTSTADWYLAILKKALEARNINAVASSVINNISVKDDSTRTDCVKRVASYYQKRYLDKRSYHSNWLFSLFHEFMHSRDEKLEAATELFKTIFNGGRLDTIDKKYQGALHDGELGKVYAYCATQLQNQPGIQNVV